MKKKIKNKEIQCQHVYEFFDSFPGYEIYDCKICGNRKYEQVIPYKDNRATWPPEKKIKGVNKTDDLSPEKK